MFRYRVVTWSILVSVLVWTGQASAGWVIDQVVKGGGEGAKQQVMLQANQMKTHMLGTDGQPVHAFILDLNAETIMLVDYDKRQYFTATIQEFGQMMQAVQQAMAGHMAKVMQEMQERMKDLPPEQRKMVESMMRSQMSQTEPEPQNCPEPRIEVRKTGQQATIAGYPAIRYDVIIDGKLDSELWLAKGIAAWQELDSSKLERFAAEMAKLGPRCGSAQGRLGFRTDDPTWKLAGEGYPVRTVNRGSDITIEVVKAQTRSVPAAELQPPVGFAKKTFRETMGQ